MTLDNKFDVIVCGAGPAGSTAARIAAEKGCKVLLLERKQEIGVPVHCAEGISESLIPEIIPEDESWIASRIKEIKMIAPDGTGVELSFQKCGYIVERKLFDKYLAEKAVESGAKILLEHTVKDVLFSGDKICGVRVTGRNRTEKDFFGDIVIAADGVDSFIGRKAGIDTTIKPHDLDICAQYQISHPAISETRLEFFVGHDIAPFGYIWIFPKKKGIANAGIGIPAPEHRTDSVWNRLTKFLDNQFPGWQMLEKSSGADPVCAPLKELVKPGFMIVGDAARQVNPLSGGGIPNAVRAGIIAGKVCSLAVTNQDFSLGMMKKYQQEWDKKRGAENKKYYRIREAVYKLNDQTYNTAARSLNSIPPEKRNLRKIFTTLLKNDPKLIIDIIRIML